MEQARDRDPERTQARALVKHWSQCLGMGRSYSAQEIISVAIRVDAHGGFQHPEFNDLLLTRCGTRGIIKPRKLGNWLMRIRGQIHGGYRIDLVQASDSHGNRYRLADLRQLDLRPPVESEPTAGRR